MDFKLLGGILLVVGTCIGAGMLALPIATGQLGFYYSALLLVVGWLVMVMGALLLLEVNLWFPASNNLITMARATLGPIGELLSWLIFLLLLYSLICAYIASGSDLLQNIFILNGVSVPRKFTVLLFTFSFGCIVYAGIKIVDYVNRSLMSIKFLTYFILIALLSPYISLPLLSQGDHQAIFSSTPMTVTLTSFGFGVIIPSLRYYFEGQIRKLRTAIIIGSLIPLLCYLAWDAVIMGVIPYQGAHGLKAILESSSTTSYLVNTLNSIIANNTLAFFVKAFTSICVLTSFLSVALALTDFLTDGLKVGQKLIERFSVQVLTFLPPMLIVIFLPSVFIKALEYAGLYCVLLQILLPTCMVWKGRYALSLSSSYRVAGGKTLLLILFCFSLFVIAKMLFNYWHF
jgi:tyrosine-specific transport protein